ncbi:MAG TPA: hypothetical protein DHW63_09890 [Hyphomonadaceae bacterium]|nr:hypothetical protein [Hyphomonadaceae bacterium]
MSERTPPGRDQSRGGSIATTISVVSAAAAIASTALALFALQSSQQSLERTLEQERQAALVSERINACVRIKASGVSLYLAAATANATLFLAGDAIDAAERQEWDRAVTAAYDASDAMRSAATLDFYGPDSLAAAQRTVLERAEELLGVLAQEPLSPETQQLMATAEALGTANSAFRDSCIEVLGPFREVRH